MEELTQLQKSVPFLEKNEELEILDIIKNNGFEIVDGGETGMVMQKTADSFGNPFFLGELLVVRAEVKLGNATGYGMTLCGNEGSALIMACADAAFSSGDSVFIKLLMEKMGPAMKRQKDRLKAEMDMTSATKVNFGLMVEG